MRCTTRFSTSMSVSIMAAFLASLLAFHCNENDHLVLELLMGFKGNTSSTHLFLCLRGIQRGHHCHPRRSITHPIFGYNCCPSHCIHCYLLSLSLSLDSFLPCLDPFPRNHRWSHLSSLFCLDPYRCNHRWSLLSSLPSSLLVPNATRVRSIASSNWWWKLDSPTFSCNTRFWNFGFGKSSHIDNVDIVG